MIVPLFPLFFGSPEIRPVLAASFSCFEILFYQKTPPLSTLPPEAGVFQKNASGTGHLPGKTCKILFVKTTATLPGASV